MNGSVRLAFIIKMQKDVAEGGDLKIPRQIPRGNNLCCGLIGFS